MKKMRYILWVLVIAGLVGFIFLSLPKNNDSSDNRQTFMPPTGYTQGNHFTLTTHEGDIINTNTEIAEGNYGLLFFGFTHCPTICPTELQKFATVMDSLPSETAARITPLFITIDPQRDTVDAMQSYVPQFHPDIIGLTGTQDQIDPILKDWKVYAARVDDPQYSDYTMDHSTYSYLVDHNMNILALFRLQTTSDEITQTITKIIH